MGMSHRQTLADLSDFHEIESTPDLSQALHAAVDALIDQRQTLFDQSDSNFQIARVSRHYFQPAIKPPEILQNYLLGVTGHSRLALAAFPEKT